MATAHTMTDGGRKAAWGLDATEVGDAFRIPPYSPGFTLSVEADDLTGTYDVEVTNDEDANGAPQNWMKLIDTTGSGDVFNTYNGQQMRWIRPNGTSATELTKLRVIVDCLPIGG